MIVDIVHTTISKQLVYSLFRKTIYILSVEHKMHSQNVCIYNREAEKHKKN